MTLRECYEQLGGDYNGAIGRMMSERLVNKIALKFLDDKSYELLQTSLAEENYEEVFRAAHTLKGVCANLSFTKLYESSSLLTEAVRSGRTPEADAYVTQVNADYAQTIDVLRRYAENPE